MVGLVSATFLALHHVMYRQYPIAENVSTALVLCEILGRGLTRVVHGLGQPTGWVGLDLVGSRFFDFWWVGLGRGSETAELKIFIKCAEFIEATNVVDTDGHGVSRQISQMFASNCFMNF